MSIATGSRPAAPRWRIAAGERFNGYSHLAGLILALGGGAVLVARAMATGEPARVAGAAVFAAASIAMYLASTVYHASQGRAKQAWRRFDHCAIYLMIAGSYTPFALAALDGAWAWALVSLMGCAALLGIAREWRADDGAAPSLPLYLGMGWVAVAAAVPLLAGLGGAVLAWLLAGAACYTLGTVFYRNRRGWAYAHGAWHLFVLGGSACHAIAIACL